MKLIKKIKNWLTMVGIFLLTLSTKVFALDPREIAIDVSLYAVPKPREEILREKIWMITHKFVIPIILVIGLIIYFRKSKSSTKKKIIVSILVIIPIIAIIEFIKIFI